MNPRGFTVVEALVGLLLTLFILQLTWTVAARQRRGLERVVRRSEVLEAERVVWWVLATEAARAGGPEDLRVTAPGVLELRAYRGRGLVCAGRTLPPGWIAVRYRGWRNPDPLKDSVLVMDGFGRWKAGDLVERTSEVGVCDSAPTERAESWKIEPPPTGAVLVRVFERGSYHLEDRAFRYRRGRSGRQPLTDEVLDPSASGLAGHPSGVEVRFRGAGSPVGTDADTGWVRLFRRGGLRGSD